MDKSTNTQWEKRLVTPKEVFYSIKPGMTIFLGSGVAEPRTLMKYLMESGVSNMNDLEVTAGGELNQADLREQIKHERLVELCGEYIRWFDLKRWGDYGPIVAEDFNVPATGDVITRHPPFAGFRLDQDELFPIPLDELDLNPNLLPQNPGW